VGPDFAAAGDSGTAVSFDAVHADILRFFPDLVMALGGDPQNLYLHVCGDAPERNAHFGYRDIVNLLEHAAASLRCPDFGMRLASLQGGSRVFGLIGVAMKNSRTLGDALAYVTQHSYAHSLAARIRLERRPDGHEAFVGHDILLERLPNRCQSMEHLLMLANLNAIEITEGRARVRKVYFRHQPISPPGTYRRYFGCDVRFDQPEDGVVFSELDLACPIAAPDARVYRSVTAFIDENFAQVNPPLHARVRGVIHQYIGTELCTNEHVAAELHLHPRTMHRRLRAEGKSFLAIKDEVRRDLALYYLPQTDLNLTHIAGKLGYAEHSVLTRNCIRWFSVPPSRLRTQLRRET
jgi:AraC-like DNA-binding protein